MTKLKTIRELKKEMKDNTDKAINLLKEKPKYYDDMIRDLANENIKDKEILSYAEQVLELIDEVVRGEKTSIDALREELKSKILGEKNGKIINSN